MCVLVSTAFSNSCNLKFIDQIYHILACDFVIDASHRSLVENKFDYYVMTTCFMTAWMEVDLWTQFDVTHVYLKSKGLW